MKRRGAQRTSVSLDKSRLSSPIFPSITHSHRTPSFMAIPQHIRQDGEAGARHDTACALPVSLFLFSPRSDFSFYSLCSIFCPHPPFLPLLLLSLSSLFLSLPSTFSVWAPNSCCCARMGLKLSQVWMAKKKQQPAAHLPHSFSFFPLNTTRSFSGGWGAPQLPSHVKNTDVVTPQTAERHTLACADTWQYVPQIHPNAAHSIGSGSPRPGRQREWSHSEATRKIPHWIGDIFCAFDVIVHIPQWRATKTGASMKVSTLLSDKGAMISARSWVWCHIFFSVWLDGAGQWKRKAAVGVCGQSPSTALGFSPSVPKKKKKHALNHLIVGCESAQCTSLLSISPSLYFSSFWPVFFSNESKTLWTDRFPAYKGGLTYEALSHTRKHARDNETSVNSTV